jgi:hypothetical protein
MKKSLLLLAATAAAASGCYDVETPTPEGVGAFRVVVKSISTVAPTTPFPPLDVVSSCVKRYGTTTTNVPAEVRGTEGCRYVIPRGQVELEVAITALDKAGQPFKFNGPVAFKVVPGKLAGDYTYHWTKLTDGQGTGKVRAERIYGEVRVWALDEPVTPNYSNGQISGDPKQLPPEPASRSYVAGASAPLLLEEPTLAAIQRPSTADTRSSPYVGQFVTIGRAPESGPVLYQNCPDEDRDGDGKVDPPKPVTLLVTGTAPSGFFVSDITACRVPDDTGTEPDGYLPGTFGAMYIYNYSYPEGLDTGDLLWTLAGSIQEFTSTTQLTFPSWTVREHVRELPPEQWNKYLKLHPPVELNLRHCGVSDELAGANTDALCGGFNNTNMKLESLESELVKVRHVRFPSVFQNCDLNGDGSVPFFCSTNSGTNSVWNYCGNAAPPDMNEVTCNINCTTGVGGTVCSERNQYTGFGQFVAEMAGPGHREVGLDDSLEQRSQPQQELILSDTVSRRTTTAHAPGRKVSLWCDLDTRYRVGDSTVTVSDSTPDTKLLPARTFTDITFSSGKDFVAVLSAVTVPTPPPGSTTPAPRCYVAHNSGTRILLTTKDAVPDLLVDCDVNDTDVDRRQQCRLLQSVTFDVVGHLRQIQPGRPRWMVMPRDAEDLCCHPGTDGQCPRPIKACQ